MSEPSLAYGPNPALSAQPGVGAGGYSEPVYSDDADPHADGDQAAVDAARAQEKEQARRDLPGEPQTSGEVKTGASPQEQLVSTPDPARDAAGGDDAARPVPGKDEKTPARKPAASKNT